MNGPGGPSAWEALQSMAHRKGATTALVAAVMIVLDGINHTLGPAGVEIAILDRQDRLSGHWKS